MRAFRLHSMLAVILCACGADKAGLVNNDGSAETKDARPENTRVNDGDTSSAAGGTIEIYVMGDLSDSGLSDGLSGQTPTDYEIAIGRYYVLSSATDPDPVLCFDHGADPVVAKMSGDNLVGACATAEVPTANYTHGRTKVDWIRYTVGGIYHALNLISPGKLTVFRALSDTTYKGQDYKAGEGLVTITAGSELQIPMTFPALPSGPGVTYETKNGELLMTFIYPKPLPIVQNNKDKHWARFHWRIKDSFRWIDRKLPGFVSEKWDVSLDPLETEVVSMFGVSGYDVTSSID